MSYCRKCGAYIPDGDVSCPACGAGTGENEGAAKARETARKDYKEYKVSGEYRSQDNRYGDREQTREYGGPGANAGVYSGQYDADAAMNRSMGYLCYLGLLFLIPFFTRPDSQFLKYHCNQGLVLTLFCVLVSACSAIPILGWLGGAAGSVFAFYCLVKGLANVSKGKRSPLPLIGHITLIK